MKKSTTLEKLTILGFCAGTIPVVAGIADETYRCRHFDLVKNIPVPEPDRPYKYHEYRFKSWFADEYDFGIAENRDAFFGVLNSHIKYILFRDFQRYGIEEKNYINLIHPAAYFSKSSAHKTGFIQEPMSVVSGFSEIGFGVSIKRGSTVGHHAILEDFVSLNPGVHVSGNVTIGEGTEIGTGSSVINNVKIGRRCMIGAGSVVTRDIPDDVIAFGNPCKVVRKNERWKNW